MLCYKYMSYERFVESILPGGAFIKVSRPCEFNDPFDCFGILKGDFNENVAREYYNLFCAGIDNSCLDIVSKVNFQARLLYRKFFDEWFRILSLTDASSVTSSGEALMWSHYGDNAKGVRLTLDFITKPKVIRYSDNPPVLDCNNVAAMNPLKDNALRVFLDECLTTKSTYWEYERECRLIISVQDEKLSPMTASDAVKPIMERNFVLLLPKESVKEVAVGPECPDVSIVQKYVSDLKRSGYENLDLLKAVKGEDYGCSYAKLEFR